MTITLSIKRLKNITTTVNTEEQIAFWSNWCPSTVESHRQKDWYTFLQTLIFKPKTIIWPLINLKVLSNHFPNLKKLEEASFFAAKSHYMMSPTYSLDQEETNTAIEKLQIFMNNYPRSKFTDECNQLISELQIKVEKKEFEVAKQYYTTYDFRAAIKSLDNFVADFVGSKFREEALYYKFLASYEIAINSIQSKKLQRLLDLNNSTTMLFDIIQKHCLRKTLPKK